MKMFSAADRNQRAIVPLVLMLFLAVNGTACANKRAPAVTTPLPSFSQEGMASWYGKEFNGRKTASGERFNMDDLTAAHPSLPFGSLVKVTNLGNGKSVVVRINDRSPNTNGRIIDLSYAAAKKIGMVQAGTARVRVELLS